MVQRYRWHTRRYSRPHRNERCHRQGLDKSKPCRNHHLPPHFTGHGLPYRHQPHYRRYYSGTNHRHPTRRCHHLPLQCATQFQYRFTWHRPMGNKIRRHKKHGRHPYSKLRHNTLQHYRSRLELL